MSTKARFARTLLSGLTLAMGGLGAACTAPDGADDGAIDDSELAVGAPKLCAAVKGNGPRILAQISSLARITEEFGELDAIAGGSSGTISTFLYESMLMNPALSTCGAKPCTPKEKSLRIALLLKSVHGYGEIVTQETGIAALAEQVGTFKGKAFPNAEEVRKTVETLRKLVNANVQAILNTNEIFAMLREPNPVKLAANLSEIRTAFDQFGNFTVPNNQIFFRVPLIDWNAATNVFGKAGDFYAGEGYGPYDRAGTAAFLDACALPSQGKTWTEVKDASTAAGTCGDMFQKLLSKHRETIASRGGNTAIKRRINDPIGGKLRAIAHSMAIRGDAVSAYESSLKEYKAGVKPNANGDMASFAPKFDDLVYGYWSGSADATTLRGLPNSAKFTDLKSKKLVAFGPRSWEYILSRSPAEPGISRLRPNDDAQARYTAGGWGDGSPSQVLRQIGCETVVLVTRRQYGSADFSRNLAAEFGAAPEAVDDLYDATRTSGVTAQSIRAADAVWCTDWDGPSTTDFVSLAREGYTAPLLTHSSKFQTYSNVVTPERAGLAGCTAGVAPKD